MSILYYIYDTNFLLGLVLVCVLNQLVTQIQHRRTKKASNSSSL